MLFKNGIDFMKRFANMPTEPQYLAMLIRPGICAKV